MDGALDITVRHERGVVIAAVTGDIDISTVSRLRESLFKLADTGRTLIVDLNRVTFIDSAGLGALVGTYRHAAARGGSLHAVCSRPQIRRLLWLTGVDRRIPLAATVDGALMFLAASRDAPPSSTELAGRAFPPSGGPRPQAGPRRQAARWICRAVARACGWPAWAAAWRSASALISPPSRTAIPVR